MLEELGREIHHVVVLTAQDGLLVRRIGGRRSCPECGSVYNVFLKPPQSDGVCDKDAASLTHRADDQPETVRYRLEVYRESTEPVIAFYENSTPAVHSVDGGGSLDRVQEDLREAIGNPVGIEAK